MPRIVAASRRAAIAVTRAAARLDRRLRVSRPAWAGAIAAVLMIDLLICLPGITGNWFAGGRDMTDILPELRAATGRSAMGWVTGPWLGHRIFNYYRPVTSLAMFEQYRLFGEHAASWQIVSLCLQLACAALFILLLRRLMGVPLAALAGGAVWIFRPKNPLAIEWTPAQTDFIATFFCLLALYSTTRALEKGSRWWLAGALAFEVLAFGSKEVAFILPILATLVALYRTDAARPARIRVICGSWVVFGAFLVWRFHCLRGMGFLPALATHNDSASHTHWTIYLSSWLRFVLPYHLGPATSVDGLAIWVFCGAAAASAWMAVRRMRAALWVAIVGLLAVTLIMESWTQWLERQTHEVLLIGLGWICLFAVAAKWNRRAFLLAIAWGTLGWLPVMHTVYNYCGNVTYLPDTYWGLLWACITAGLLAAGAAPVPVTDTVPAEPELAPA